MKHLRPRCEVCGGAQAHSVSRQTLVCINDYCPSNTEHQQARDTVDGVAVGIRWFIGLSILAVKAVIIYAAFRYVFGGN